MIEVKDLLVEVDNRIVLENFNLKVRKGEVHLIMGPNGSGKSTFAKVIAGHPFFKVKKGSVKYLKKDLLSLDAEKRASQGIFVSFQYPQEIENISNFDFLFEIYNLRNFKKLKKEAFKELLEKKMDILKMDKKLQERGVNVGFSGGEKKKNEILQLELFSSKFIILDEIDSGLDMDSLKIVSQRINEMKSKDNSIVLISHYLNLLKYIEIDFVHILKKGKIVKTGKADLVKIIKEKGYRDLYEN